MHKNEHNIELLILSYLEEKCTTDEEAFLLAWMEESEDNKKQVRDFLAVYHQVDSLQTLEKGDTAIAWSKIKQRTMPQRKPRKIISMIQRVAAVLLLPLLIGSIYLWQQNRKKNTTWIHLRTNPGMVASFTLPDSSIVWLNANSSISYPQQFGKLRDVKLDGEAFFAVSADKEKRFLVHTPQQATVEVVGTRFNVEAYANRQNMRATLEEGRVNLLYKDSSSSKRYIMKVGETILFNSNSNIVSIDDVHVATMTSWKDNQIILKNTSMDEFLNIMTKRFNAEFILKSESMRKHRFTGVFDSQQLNSVLEHLRISSGINYRIIDQDITSNSPVKVELF